MSNELTLQEAAGLWAKRVQVQTTDKHGKWWNIEKPGEFVGGGLTAGVFTTNEKDRAFRLAPEPPAKRYRPYTRQELDGIRLLGEVVVNKDRKYRALITGVLEEAIVIGLSHYTFADFLEHFTWSGGSRCGVEVES